MFIFPLSSTKKMRKFPWVTLMLIAFNAVVFMATWDKVSRVSSEAYEIRQKVNEKSVEITTLKGKIKYNEEYQSYYKKPGSKAYLSNRIYRDKAALEKAQSELDELTARLKWLENENVYMQYGFRETKIGQVYRLFTHQFLHGGYGHLIFNMVFLWFVGCNMEDKWGKLLFLLFYLSCGVVAALSYSLALNTGDVPLVGASGAIAGVMGAFMVRYPTTKVKVIYFIWIWFFVRIGVGKWQAWVFFIIWFMMQLFSAFFSLLIPDPVAYWAHVGGFIYGGLMAGVMVWSGFEKKYITPRIQAEEKKVLNVNPGVLDARDLLQEEKYNEAEAILRKVIKEEPNSIDAYEMLIKLLSKYWSLKIDEIREFTAKVIELSARKGDENRCMRSYVSIREHAQGMKLTMNTWMFIGRIYDSRGDHYEAINIFKMITEKFGQDPLSSKAFFQLGRLYVVTGNIREAQKTFRLLRDRPDGQQWKEMMDRLRDTTNVQWEG